MRREIPLIITAIVGLFMILSFFIPHPLVSGTAGTFKEWFLVIAAFAIVLGIDNLIRVNARRIKRKEPDWGFKVVTLVALIGYSLVGIVTDVQSDIRPTWLTRALHLVTPDRKEILDGRERLLDHREEVASIIEGAGSAPAAAEQLAREMGFDAKVVAPDLAGLGAAGVRALAAAEVQQKLDAAWESPDTPQTRLTTLEGRLRVTGIRGLVLAELGKDRDAAATHRALMEHFALTYDQATDMEDLGPAGVRGVTKGLLQQDRAALDQAEKQADANRVKNPSEWMFKYLYTPLQATMFSLLAFFIASAAFRAFRMRTLEAGLLLVAGILVMCGRVPLGQFNWHLSAGQDFGFHTIMQWIMNVPTTAAMRGIKMGAAMGVIVMGIKVILGIERSYLGGD